jgi:hypothetical protein
MSSKTSTRRLLFIPICAVLAIAALAAWQAIRSHILTEREEARKALSMNNLKVLWFGLDGYARQHGGRLPPAAIHGRDGKPLLSWRVAILPYIDKPLYDEFRKDESWDSPHNRALVERMPEFYRSPGNSTLSPGETCYLAPTGEHEAFFGTKGRLWFEFLVKPTAFIVEAAPDRKVIWTKPDDLIVDENNPAAGLGGWREGEFLTAYRDGAVHAIPLSATASELRALFRIDSTDPASASFSQ